MPSTARPQKSARALEPPKPKDETPTIWLFPRGDAKSSEVHK